MVESILEREFLPPLSLLPSLLALTLPQYRTLKKAIGKAEAEVDEAEARRQEEVLGEGRSRSPTQMEGAAAGLDRSGASRDLERGLEEEEGDADDESVRGKTSVPPPMSPLDSQISRRSSHYSRTSRTVGETDTQGTEAPLFKSSARPPPLHRGQRSILDTLTLPKLRRDTLVEFDLNCLGHQCRRFFTLLDRELDKVSSFYGEREEAAIRRFEELSEQWKELADHKKEFQVSFSLHFRAQKADAGSCRLSALESTRRPPCLLPSSHACLLPSSYQAQVSFGGPSLNEPLVRKNYPHRR